MNNKQAFNPFLPSYEYVPDGEPKVFGDRVYLYGSHDKFNAISFCVNDYVCWSASVDNLADWRYEGIIFKKKQDSKWNVGFLNSLFAPDVVQGADKRYYLYYFIGFKGYIGVAVCETPCGKFEYLGKVHYSDGVALGEKNEPLQFDPGVLVDDDGKVYLYNGFSPVDFPKMLIKNKKPTTKGAMVFELESDMITIKTNEPKYICKTKFNGKNTDFEGHEFFEASSIRKFDGKYYFIYSSILGHELCWAVSDKADSGFVYGGTLVSNGDIGISDKPLNYTGNTHGSVAKIKDNYYVFYHRQTNKHQFSRQACAEQIKFENGKFFQAEITSCGLNGKALSGIGKYEARTACNLYSKEGIYFYGAFKKRSKTHPYFTQFGKDREINPNQHIANFCDGSVAVFKYFELGEANKISVAVSGNAKGIIKVTGNKDEMLSEIIISPSKTSINYIAKLTKTSGKSVLKFQFIGKGTMRFYNFELSD